MKIGIKIFIETYFFLLNYKQFKFTLDKARWRYRTKQRYERDKTILLYLYPLSSNFNCVQFNKINKKINKISLITNILLF